MVLDSQRQNVDPLLNKIARPFLKINPDVLSVLALISALVGGIALYLSNSEPPTTHYLLLIASIFVLLNGLFDAIDGKVAKLTNKASKRGDYLDHAFDRFADVFIVGGLALSSWTRLDLGLIAISAMLLTSYMGTQAQAVGAKRNYGGLMGRADRLILLTIFPVLQYIQTLYPQYQPPYQLSILDFLLLILALVGSLTIIQRFIQTLRWFKDNET